MSKPEENQAASCEENDLDDEETRENFLFELHELENKVESIWREFEDARHKLNQNHNRITKCTGQWADVNKKLKDLKDIFDNDLSEYSKNKGMKDSSGDDNGNLKNGNDGKSATPTMDSLNYDKNQPIATRLSVLSNDISELKTIKQRVGSLFLRFMVGRVSMRVWTDNERNLLKEEYHKFKFRTNFIFIAFPILQLLWVHMFGQFSWVLHQWHHLWLLYYYLSLAVRESVLKLNGSRLHVWWIYHHHISTLGSFLSILLMRSAYERYHYIFDVTTWMLLIIGFMQVWQNRYQMKRHYTRRALGKALPLDISATETIINEANTESQFEFKCLKFACYFVYFLEIIMGLGTIMFVINNDDSKNESKTFDLFQFEAILCGLLFISISIGNSYALHYRPHKNKHLSQKHLRKLQRRISNAFGIGKNKNKNKSMSRSFSMHHNTINRINNTNNGSVSKSSTKMNNQSVQSMESQSNSNSNSSSYNSDSSIGSENENKDFSQMKRSKSFDKFPKMRHLRMSALNKTPIKRPTKEPYIISDDLPNDYINNGKQNNNNSSNNEIHKRNVANITSSLPQLSSLTAQNVAMLNSNNHGNNYSMNRKIQILNKGNTNQLSSNNSSTIIDDINKDKEKHV